jgi:fibronectin type 3 domain-containing protein
MCLAPDRSLAREDVKGGVLKFDFGPGKAAPGYTRVLSTTVYTKNLGYGFEAGTQIKGVDRGGKDALRGDFCTSERPFFFSVALPEGNYNVTVILGDAAGERVTTVKAELLITIHE